MTAPARSLPDPPARRSRGGEPAVRVTSRRPAEAAPEAVERPALRVVPRRVRQRRAGLVVVAALASLFALMLGLVAFQARIAQDQLRLDRLERQVGDAEARLGKLRLVVAQLESPERVVAEAGQLGLVRPQPDSVTYLTPSLATVTAVDGNLGPVDGGQPAAGAGIEDWGALKSVLQGAP